MSRIVDDLQIRKDLFIALNDVAEKYKNNYGVFGVFLMGSQNFNTDTEESDVDVVAILVPKFKTLCSADPLLSTSYDYTGTDSPRLEKITVMDIRLLVDRLLKGNITFWQLSTTPYFMAGKEFHGQVSLFTGMSTWIFFDYVCDKAIDSSVGMVRQNLSRYEKLVGKEDADIKACGKALAEGYTIAKVATDYLTSEKTLKSVIRLNDKEGDLVRRLKTGEFSGEDQEKVINYMNTFVLNFASQSKIQAKVNEKKLRSANFANKNQLTRFILDKVVRQSVSIALFPPFSF